MKVLKKYAPDAISEVEYASFAGQVVALDIFLIIYKFVIAIRNKGSDLQSDDGKMTSHIFGAMSKITNMLKYGMIPVAVFDGKAPKIKNNTIQERTKRKKEAIDKMNNEQYKDDYVKYYKRTFNIMGEHIKDVKRLFSLIGFLNVQAPEEADSQCAALNMSHFVDAVATEDTDVLAFGTNKMLKQFSSKDKVMEIDKGKILQDLGLDNGQFIDLCIILGTDYCKRIKGIGPEVAYVEYKKYGNMIEFLNHLNNVNKKCVKDGKEPKYDIPLQFIENWEETKEYYKSAIVTDPCEFTKNPINNYWTKPDKNGLIQFLCVENGFDLDETNKKIDYLMKRYNLFVKYGKLDADWNEINKNKNRNKKRVINVDSGMNRTFNIKSNKVR